MKRARPAMLTETLEVVRMSSMLPAVLLFVGGSPSFCVYTENFPPRSWYPGIVIRGSQLTDWLGCQVITTLIFVELLNVPRFGQIEPAALK